MSHSPALSTGLNANGVDLTRSDLRILFRIVSGGPESTWEVRGSDTTIPMADGQTARDRKRHRLPIVAEGHVMGTGISATAERADFADVRQVVRDVMEPTQAPYTLTYTDTDGSTWTITARPVNVLWGDDSLPTYREGSLQWLAVGADWVQTGGGS